MSLNWLSASRARQTICRTLSRHAGTDAGTAMSADRGVFTALLFTFLTMVLLLALTPHTAHAHGGLSLGLRIQQEFYKPLVPVARNFKTCFKTDPATGIQVMSFCTEAQNRIPATTPATNTTPATKAPPTTPTTHRSSRPPKDPPLF